MAQDWFDQVAAPVQTPTQRPQAQYPGIIQGRPKQVDPRLERNDAISQANEAERLRMAREDQVLQREAAMRSQQEAMAKQQERALRGGADTTESERTAGFLATRLSAGLKDWSTTIKENPDAALPGFFTEAVRKIAGDTPANYMTSADRQKVEASQIDMIDAALTLGTGAAYTREQLEGYRKAYFPVLGDTTETVAAKEKKLLTLLEAAKVKAGAAAPLIDEALLAAGYGQSGPLAVNVTDDSQPAPAVNATPQQNGQSATPAPDGGWTLRDSLSQTGDIVQGMGDVVGIVANPVGAGINAVAGQQILSEDFGADLRNALGFPESRNDIAAAAGRLGGSALLPAGVASALKPVAGAIGGGTEAAINFLAREPAQQVAAGVGAGAAGKYAEDNGAGPLGQIAASVAGGMTGYGGVNALMRGGQRMATAPNSLLQAGQRQGVDILPADVGGAATRRVTSAAAQAPVSASPIINAAKRTQEQIGKSASRAARSQGEVLPVDEAGQEIRKAGNLYIKNETAKISGMYDRAQEAAKGVRIKPKQAIEEIDAQIARFSELGEVGKSSVASLQQLRSSIEGGISVSGLRDARSMLSQSVYDGKLRSGQEQKLMRDILGKLSEDIDGGLRSIGREGAANAFRRADTLWRARIEQIDEVLEPVIGKTKSGEDIIRAVEGMARGSNGGIARLTRLMREIPKEQSGNIRATVIDRLGKAAAGAQDETGEVFSASTFLTNWNKMSPKAKNALFGSDGNLRANLDDIAKITSSVKEAGKYANSSNTGGAMIGNVGGIFGVGAYTSPWVIPVTLGSQYATGRLMASPTFARWLAKAPQNASRSYVERLGLIAAQEPMIANDARALQQYLGEQLAKSPGSAAAQDASNGRREPPAKR